MKKISLKKNSVVIVVLLIMLMLTTLTAHASEKVSYFDYTKMAKEVIESYYKARDLGEEYNFGKNMEPEVQAILSAKIDIKQHAIVIYGDKIENYNIDVELAEKKKIEDKVYLKFQVSVTYNYADLPDVESGNYDVIEVLLDGGNNKIIDVYQPFEFFDIDVRGEGFDILNYNKAKSSELKLVDTIESKRADLVEAIDNEYNLVTSKISNNNEALMNPSIEMETRGTRYNLNKDAIKTYARANYYKTSPSSGGGNVPYYDFSQLSGAWDCTNFVSHALLAGGATVYDTGGSGISSTGWYYRSLSNRSSSWSGVINLHNFMTTNTTKGPGGLSEIYSTRPGHNHIGNILQFHNGSIWRHSTIVTGLYTMDDRVGALVTGRSSAVSNNNNEKASLIYAGYAKRTIYPYNYR